ncbi:MAG: TVP38/TMEM64 family protein [Candidatus Promineifilaceae bacterium]
MLEITATSEQRTEKDTAVEPVEVAGKDNGTKTPSNRRIAVSLIIIAIFILLTIAFWHWWDQLHALIKFVSDQEAFGEYLRSFGVMAPLVLFMAQMIQVFIAFIPGHVVSISGGYVFGFAWGFIMNLSFTVFASQMAYFLARYAGRPIVYRLADRETVDYWERVANTRGTLFFTIAFLLPIFPSDAMNFVGGLSGISAGKFLFANFFGRMPSAIMLTMIGAYGTEFSNVAWAIIILIFVVVLIAGNYGARWIRRTLDEMDDAETDLLVQEHRSTELPAPLENSKQ